MIDMHTHILPNIDDGADDISTAAELLRLEAEQGIKEIVFTPHYDGKKNVAEFLELRMEAFESIKKYVPKGMKTRLGTEVLLTGINDPTDEALCALAIEGTKCVLIELPFSAEWSDRLWDKLANFVSDTGYTPIIAHVERYQEALENPIVVSYLIDMGCLIQLNAEAFLKKKTRRFAFALLKHGLVHCISTDTHDLSSRAPDYQEVKALICKKGCEDEWTDVQWCMKKILVGEAVRKPKKNVRKLWNWYF